MIKKLFRSIPPLKLTTIFTVLVILSLNAYGQQENADTLKHAVGEKDSITLQADVPAEDLEESIAESSEDSIDIPSGVDDTRYFDEKNTTTLESLTDKYESRKIPAEVIRNSKSDPAFWYANAELKQEKEEDKQVRRPFIFSRNFQRIVWIMAIAGFITFLVIYLRNSNISLFRRSKNITSSDEAEPETDDIFSINYQKEIDKAVAASNFRLATRLMFLRLLRTLSEKQIIQYTQDRTNFDYLMQLRSSNWYNDFFRVTRDYEYSWYGQFTLDADKFNLIRKDFEGLENKLRY